MLEQAVTNNTVAIVGVNLFGLSERWPQLRKLADLHNIVLIEDSAQYFPGSGEKQDWQGDLVVFSFGRGKAVSLLGGGAVYCQQAKFKKLLPDVEPEPESVKQQLVFNLKVKTYNILLSPYLYWLPQSLPFLHLGETRYHALHDIGGMPAARFDLLATNIGNYQADSEVKERYMHYFSLLNAFQAVKNLPQLCQQEQGGHYRRLIRYPVLLEPEQRAHIFSAIHDAGLGASLMYPVCMPVISGLQEFFSAEQENKYPNAVAFAQQILTLPMHTNVSNKTIEQITTILKKYL
jgi:dTDP-4-amino-4,6-dideoxygalactose transaminase